MFMGQRRGIIGYKEIDPAAKKLIEQAADELRLVFDEEGLLTKKCDRATTIGQWEEFFLKVNQKLTGNGNGNRAGPIEPGISLFGGPICR